MQLSMTDLFEVIKNRRSIRKYTSKPVQKEVILEVLDAAGCAPSAHNSQPWRFIILQDATVKRNLAAAMAEAWVKDLQRDGIKVEPDKRAERIERFTTAPVLILACVTVVDLRKFPDSERQMCERDLAVQSFGAALQNLLLAAHAKGLGACWFCAPLFCKETVRKILKIPDAIEPQAFVAMGYPAEKPQVPIKKLLEGYCFVDIWGKTF
jgi:coenzyme F420-0:L-glutamate ligase / coenzyme F420-1:gamma-L-glutamate ligase